LLQPLQLFGSLLVSTQPSAHSMYGDTHAESHTPSTQVGVALGGGIQTIPHMPQFAVLVSVSTQEPLQSSVVPLQVEPQVPPAHTSVPLQALAQSPQCAPSDARSTHLPLQFV
jgi:hypothetical protein